MLSLPIRRPGHKTPGRYSKGWNASLAFSIEGVALAAWAPRVPPNGLQPPLARASVRNSEGGMTLLHPAERGYCQQIWLRRPATDDRQARSPWPSASKRYRVSSDLFLLLPCSWSVLVWFRNAAVARASWP